MRILISETALHSQSSPLGAFTLRQADRTNRSGSRVANVASGRYHLFECGSKKHTWRTKFGGVVTSDTELPFPKSLMASLIRTNTFSALLALKVSISVSTAWPPIQLGLRWRCVHASQRSNKWGSDAYSMLTAPGRVFEKHWRKCWRATRGGDFKWKNHFFSVVGVRQPWQVAANARNTGKFCRGKHGRLQLTRTFSLSIQVGQKQKHNHLCLWGKVSLSPLSYSPVTSRCCRRCWVLRWLVSNCLHGYSHYGARGSRGNCCYPLLPTSGLSLWKGEAKFIRAPPIWKRK